ncbi:MAG: aspartate kinase [Zhenhengia sp.]|uniref:Aspartokinase n=1 Tax=Zhenhengia yiwuensis TaxID=2763666 RepID=A0A926ELS2_9FIRM|nr:aspartate kinase [Zhenhengia yiwuensis]MBS5798827.1 aspartate kinase [Clostridiales bacterium]MDU6359314.1 aspartate kinase [Clostridiales bacterium]
MLIVQKFGGSSVANTERIFNVAQRIAETYKEGNEVVVVLSAQGDTTDDLIAKAKEISSKPTKREMDMLLSTGEQQSVALMAMALSELGLPAISLNAYQVGMMTTSAYMNARLKKIKPDRIRRELDRKNIVLVTGFQGMNRFDDITTLGRGGSDTTAVAIAAALHADKCEIYTDVEGVYTADPRIVKSARKMDEITYDEMLELASLGARVLHNRSVELAKKYNVELVVRSSLSRAEGTVVKEVCKMERMLISGVAGDNEIARVSLIGIEDTPGKAFDIFATLAKKGINVDIILQSIGRDGMKDISFTVAETALADVKEIVATHMDRWGLTDVDYNENLAKVSVVGAGMVANAGVASKMFEAMYDSNINIHMISTSEIKISILIDKKDMHKAMNAIHDAFQLVD